jgi:hypothetical protein
MAETVVTRAADASFDASTGMVAPQVSQRILGADVAGALIPLRMASDGMLYPASAAAANANARIFGWSTRKGRAGEPMSVYGLGAVGRYSDEGLTPGAIYYLGETAGASSSIATTGDAVGCLQAIDAANVRITRNI